MKLQKLSAKAAFFSALFVIAAVLIVPQEVHAESKKGGKFGKPLDYDWEPSGGDPAKGPGLLDAATIKIGNRVIGTGKAKEGGPSASEISKADRARKARQMRNRSVDSTTPR